MNILLAVTWAAMIGQLSLPNLVTGFVFGYLVLFFVQRALGESYYFGKVRRAAIFALFFLWELLKANLRVAREVVTPQHYMKPAVIAIPLDVKSDVEITFLANLITMTPGTLSLEVSSDRSVLYIHTMYVEDPDVLRREIKEGFERWVIELLR